MDSFERSILEFPKQLDPRIGRTANLGKLRGKRPDGVVVCGLGGSGLVGDILHDTAGGIDLPVPVVVVKDSALPPLPFKRPLYVCISFSGDTKETLACLEAALKTKAKSGLAVLTGRGGKMRQVAERFGLPAAFFEPGSLTPRQASGKMYLGLITLLQAAFPRMAVPNLSKRIRTAGLAAQGARIAGQIKRKNVLVYCDSARTSLGYFWKITLNETGKNAAFTNRYPEIDHNEIEGFANLKGPWLALWLTDPSMKKMAKDKLKFLERALECGGIKSVEIPLRGRTSLEKLWNGVALAEWTGYALAKLNGVRPEETKAIDEMKRRFK